MNKKRLVVILICIIVVPILVLVILSNVNYKSEIVMGGKVFTVHVVDTERFLRKGLSGRKSLSSNTGMLFAFQKEDLHGFWMKDMHFSIDIIWLDSNFTIVDVRKSVSPETYPDIFYPKKQALYVLEVSSGQFDNLKLKIGDSIRFLKKYF